MLFRKKMKSVLKVLSGVTLLSFLAACPGGIGGLSGDSINLSKPVKIALLVPLSGDERQANLGRELEAAARIALSDFNTNDVEMMVFDTAGTPALAASKAAEAEQLGAKIIIGPLKSVEVSTVVNATSIPIFTFSNNASIAGGKVVVFGSTFDRITERLAQYASSIGKTRAGLLISEGISGATAADSARKSFSKYGISINYEGSYPLSVEGIRQKTPSFVAGLRNANADSVIFTDTPSGGLAFLASSMASEGYSSQFVNYLGVARWDVSGNDLAHSSLEGGYFVAPNPQKTQLIDDRIKSVVGESGGISNVSYDAVSAAIHLIKNAKANGNNTPFTSAALQKLTFPGASGISSIGADGIVNRPLAIMQVRGGKAVPVSLSQ